MSSTRTDFRTLRAKRAAAMHRHALDATREGKAKAPDPADVAAAIAAGRFVKLPPKRRAKP